MIACASLGSSAKDFVAFFLDSCRKEDLVLKPKQLETLKYIFQGKDVFVWIPTSYGKCYQALHFMFDCKLGRCISGPVDKCRASSIVIGVLMIDLGTS